MSKKFYAVNRETGERWKPDKRRDTKQYLMMYDSGYLAVVEEDYYTHITALDYTVWKAVIKENILK